METLSSQRKEQPERRRKVIERLFRVWQENPKLSFGQLIHRATKGVHMEYVFDDELLALVESGLSKTRRRELNRELPL